MIIHQPSMEDLREIIIEGKKTPMMVENNTKKTIIIRPKKSEAVAAWENQGETASHEELHVDASIEVQNFPLQTQPATINNQMSTMRLRNTITQLRDNKIANINILE